MTIRLLCDSVNEVNQSAIDPNNHFDLILFEPNESIKGNVRDKGYTITQDNQPKSTASAQYIDRSTSNSFFFKRKLALTKESNIKRTFSDSVMLHGLFGETNRINLNNKKQNPLRRRSISL